MQYVISFLIVGLPTSFFLQLIVAALMFSRPLHRRNNFPMRAWCTGIGFTVVSLLFFYLCYISGVWLLSDLLSYLLLFCLSLLFLEICFDESFPSLLLCATCGYMTQHIASQFVQTLFNAPTATELDVHILFLFSLQNLASYAVVYLIVWALFARRSRAVANAGSASRALVGLSVVTLIVVLVLSAVRDTFAGESFVLMVITRIFSVFCCVILLYMRAMIVERQEAETENALLKELGDLREKQYAESKETIELINIKAHDMRHRLSALHEEDRAEIDELVELYDSAVETGSDTLDTLLTEKSIFCEKHGITLSCMADGACLSFLSVGDACTLLGNALENAIEAVLRIDEPEKRRIAFRVRERMGMAVITVDNNYAGEITLLDGLPKSSKGDDQNHGFGMKSICRTAEKYGGEAIVTVDDQFHLSVLLPVP